MAKQNESHKHYGRELAAQSIHQNPTAVPRDQLERHDRFANNKYDTFKGEDFSQSCRNKIAVSQHAHSKNLSTLHRKMA